MINKDIQELMKDPRWGDIEALIHKQIDPLMDWNTVDTTQPAEHVKAEVIARKLAHNAMAEFLNQTLLVQNKIEKVSNPFK